MNSTAKAVNKARLVRGPALEVLVPISRGMPFDEALRVAEQGRRVLASNARMSKALVGSDEWRSILEVFACWTGTMTAYTKPGEKLGATVEYVDPETKERWVFPVPEQFRGMKNTILVAEHPDYTLERDGKNLVVQAGMVDVVENFPAQNYVWYLADAKHGIPQGDAVSRTEMDARFLLIIDSRVGPVGRGCNCDRLGGYYDRRSVNLDDRPSYGFGVAVEAPEGGAEKSVAPSQSTGLRLTREGGRLIVEGTPEQLRAAEEMLRQIR